MIRFTDWGVIDYKQAWDRQTEIFTELIYAKKSPGYLDIADQRQQVIFCEHPHVYTLGAHGDTSNMLIQDERLKSLGATFYKTDRGGDITYHGYGQIVVYPIVDLEVLNLSLKQYVHCLEEAVIQTLLRYGLKAERAKGATGVWFEYETSSARKICAVGVRASHFVTMHGIAFNVATDLDYFSYINPCGFVDKGVTSLEKELGKPIDIEEVKAILKEELARLLHR
jgi:lipoyl(octanoyl) transferase